MVRSICVLLAVAGSYYLGAYTDLSLFLLPTAVAFALILATRSAFVGLLAGAFCGALVISLRSSDGLFTYILNEQFLPIFSSPWKLSAIFFTLILGGFVALLEAGGGLQSLLRKCLGEGKHLGQLTAERMQTTVFGFGLLVFFDGLANTMLVGRLLRSAADRAEVSREKLAYLADTTGSAIACVAFISTWIAFQLSMIQKGFEDAGVESVNAYSYFFRSIPANFYCWFALFFAFVSIWRRFDYRSMRASAPVPARPFVPEVSTLIGEGKRESVFAILSIVVLAVSVPGLAYVIGADPFWPISFEGFATAYGRAESNVPLILVLSAVFASAVAGLGLRIKGGTNSLGTIAKTFWRGVADLAGPVLILFAAWMLGQAVSDLGTAEWLSSFLGESLNPVWFPAVIFLAGAFISFSTGTSWGTMAILMPLAIPVTFGFYGEGFDLERDKMVVSAIGAVFSGAVFGDHCSPFSDTTIVSSVAAGISPYDHFRTQMPYALTAGVVALVFGFLAAGAGLHYVVCLLLGAAILFFIPSLVRRRGSVT